MVSVNEVIDRLKRIYLSERKTWQEVGNLIEYYEEKLEEEREMGMKMMKMMMFMIGTGSLASPGEKEKVVKTKSVTAIPHSAILVHCILEDANVDIRKCKDCKTQCVNYLKEYKQLEQE